MVHRIINFFDKLEDYIRGHLSRYPIVYTIIGGVAIVLFWRGVWHTADILEAKGGFLGFLFYEPTSLLIVTAILLATGLFVSYFIGDAILLSGVKSQKKLADKTEKEVKDEEASLIEIKHVVESIEHEMHDLKRGVDRDFRKLKKEVEHDHLTHHAEHEHLTKEKEIKDEDVKK
jgi:hypothetical protein